MNSIVFFVRFVSFRCFVLKIPCFRMATRYRHEIF